LRVEEDGKCSRRKKERTKERGRLERNAVRWPGQAKNGSVEESKKETILKEWQGRNCKERNNK
jgi:hypothetical protein